MLRFKQYLKEVAMAKSEVDKEVVAMHPIKITNTPHPDSGETVVKTKKDTSRRADNQPGEDETKYSAHNKRGKVAEYHESEELEEISKARLTDYSKASHKAIKGNQPSDPAKAKKRVNREQGVKNAYNKYHNWKVKVAATESEELDEISKERLGAYVKSATKNKEWHDKGEVYFRNKATREDDYTKSVKGSEKRSKGIAKATKKISESEYDTENNKNKVKRIKHEKGEIKIMSGRAKEDNS